MDECRIGTREDSMSERQEVLALGEDLIFHAGEETDEQRIERERSLHAGPDGEDDSADQPD